MIIDEDCDQSVSNTINMEDLGSGVITVIRQLIIRECGRKSADSNTATAVGAVARSERTLQMDAGWPAIFLALQMYRAVTMIGSTVFLDYCIFI